MREINERTVEYPYALSALKYLSGNNLADIGTGTNPVFSELLEYMGYFVTRTDILSVPGVVRDDITNTHLKSDFFDGVFCLSVLEHIPEYELAVNGLYKILHPGGIAVITVPFCPHTYVHNIYCPGNKHATKLCHLFTRSSINKWVALFGECISHMYWRVWTGPTWRSGDRILPTPIVCNKLRAQLAGVILRKSHGYATPGSSEAQQNKSQSC